VALQVGKNTVAAFVVKAAELRVKKLPVIHGADYKRAGGGVIVRSMPGYKIR